MHEMSIMAGLLEIIQGEARIQGFARVTRVGLEIGRLSGVEAEAMRFAFDVCTAGTVAEGAELEIEATGGLGRCASCALDFPLDTFQGSCPSCGGSELRVVSGRELRVQYLDVD